ncbi:MAG: FCD domain-containing protein [Proteobacteria bacterium]|nr:FCD domain-containing protein [Pseudomonadota bacterium]
MKLQQATKKRMSSLNEKMRSFEEISARIKNSVFKGELKPGDRLPSEAELGRHFNVGRQTIREALRFLELSGFISIQRGRKGGPIIRDTVLDAVNRSLLDAFQLQNITIDEITVARLAIEKSVLPYGVVNMTASDIRGLEKNILEARKKLERGVRASSHNIEFHRLLARASRNTVFIVVVESIMAIAADYLSRANPHLERSKRALDYHEALLEAIKGRDTDKALEILDDHLRGL